VQCFSITAVNVHVRAHANNSLIGYQVIKDRWSLVLLSQLLCSSMVALVRAQLLGLSFREGQLAIRQGPWKLIFHETGERELFNLQADLSETSNIADENSVVVNRLTKLFQSYIDRGRSTPGAPQKNEFALAVTHNRERGAK
jgi:hypothetical protein